MGWAYGYYAEDPNFKGGVRAIIEAVYEPPQIGDISGFQLLNDDHENLVNMVASALSLEKIGWIYTTLSHDTFMDAETIRKAASY
jgi:nuclear protein localization family protein 4